MIFSAAIAGIALYGVDDTILDLKKDGTVCTGVVSKDHSNSAYEGYGLSEADSWTDIVEVAVGWTQIVGLKKDGTVVTAGFSTSDFEGVDQWSNIVDVDAGQSITVALKADGTVVTCDLAPDVSGWTDIVAVSCSSNYVVGLKSDGTVVAASGEGDDDPRTDVSGWSDIVAISGQSPILCKHPIGANRAKISKGAEGSRSLRRHISGEGAVCQGPAGSVRHPVRKVHS